VRHKTLSQSIKQSVGSMIYLVADSIEANVETAATSVEEGNEQLRQARRHQVRFAIYIFVKCPKKIFSLRNGRSLKI